MAFYHKYNLMYFSLLFAGGENGSEAEMGVPPSGKAEKGYHSGVQGGLCAVHNWQKACNVCVV